MTYKNARYWENHLRNIQYSMLQLRELRAAGLYAYWQYAESRAIYLQSTKTARAEWLEALALEPPSTAIPPLPEGVIALDMRPFREAIKSLGNAFTKYNEAGEVSRAFGRAIERGHRLALPSGLPEAEIPWSAMSWQERADAMRMEGRGHG